MLLTSVAILLFAPASVASAHPLSVTALLLDVGEGEVTAKVELPLDELSIALDQQYTAANVVDTSTLSELRAYIHDHMSASDAAGRSWTTVVAGGHIEQVDGVDNLVLDATMTPQSGDVGNFVLHYDAILDKLESHHVFVSARYGTSGAYTTLAMLSWQRESVPVARTGPSESEGFLAAVHLGIQHISSGSDHLLFLITLLLPAPLVVARRRWVRTTDRGGRAGWRVVHVVTAFAVGHSITLALGALSLINLPARLVESGIALSVLVSAIHAIRPIVRRGEVIIAATFGLLHGLAFATLIGGLDLSRGGLVVTLLGFNLGIELTQLLVVALVMPSLMVLSRTAVYPAFRTTTAAIAAALAAGWLAQRGGLASSNPLEPVGDLLTGHPLFLAAGLALLAVVSATGQRALQSPHPGHRTLSKGFAPHIGRVRTAPAAAMTLILPRNESPHQTRHATPSAVEGPGATAGGGS